MSVDMSDSCDHGVCTLLEDGVPRDFFESRLIKPFDWKDYRRRYIRRNMKMLCYAVTHGFWVYSNYYEDGFDIKFIRLRTPRQVKWFLKKAWHCPNIEIRDRWMQSYSIRKNRLVPVCVWKDSSKLIDKYERLYAKK